MEKIVYVGKDLEAMSFAVNYHKWISRNFLGLLGKSIVEVGAGTGSFSKLILETKPQTLILIEPSDLFYNPKTNISQIQPQTLVVFYNSIFSAVAGEIAEGEKPDSIIYVNVLEHIKDDFEELKLIYQTLPAGGRCFLFVPALNALYGNFDRKLGHFRRYRKKDLEVKCIEAGFKVLKSKYFDLAGIVPWYIKYKLLQSEELSAGSVSLYDKLIVPISSTIETLVKIPAGKNILLIGEK